MLKRLLLLLAVTGMVSACGSSQDPAKNTAEANRLEETTPEKSAATENKGEHFGETIDAEGAISYDEMLRELAGKDSLRVKVAGDVAAVCQAKGCWMNISPEAEGPELFVKFKDYGFFVPKDIAGRRVVMEGYAYREVTSVDELRHFAEDAGKSEEEIQAITEPREELKFLASGVLLLDEDN